MFREIRISSPGLPQKLSVPSEKVDLECQQKQQEQLFCSACPLLWPGEKPGDKTVLQQLLLGHRVDTEPKAHPEATGTPDSTSSDHKVTQKGKTGSQTCPGSPNWRAQEQWMSQGAVVTHTEQKAAPNCHQETGSDLSTDSSPNLEIC